ncbi:cbb3-type cytochrome oxidase assembly protein CcoS [Roseitranquillus sediminis]|uniref:cbb3-type cytochrome oxidase assembly protein CcoS n=1 Tax=Roseitranquillus sediminis TaxID=2809051 RepID=UPI001D0C1546|nr:cbb3-type cytochrome oxidase assembly protein CcoS [Roseitranquillus sediminis]MBM9594587.1 cbb3-type cytochrome oxidase assembly protein CcoS [Roseitranquillus sediminis]
MSILSLLIPASLILGLVGLGAFLWSLRSGQYEDLTGSAERILLDEDDKPLPPASDAQRPQGSSESQARLSRSDQ